MSVFLGGPLGGARVVMPSGSVSGQFSGSVSAALIRKRRRISGFGTNRPRTWADGGVMAWAGTTPVLGGLRRPDTRSRSALPIASGVVPAHAHVNHRLAMKEEP